jgi:hypothetical protein
MAPKSPLEGSAGANMPITTCGACRVGTATADAEHLQAAAGRGEVAEFGFGEAGVEQNVALLSG